MTVRFCLRDRPSRRPKSLGSTVASVLGFKALSQNRRARARLATALRPSASAPSRNEKHDHCGRAEEDNNLLPTHEQLPFLVFDETGLSGASVPCQSLLRII